MTTRGLGLVGRFGLTIYIAHYLGIRSVGIFGLITGVSGAAPAVFAFGLHFVLNRAIIGLPLAQAGRLVRDRILITMIAPTMVGLGLAGALKVWSPPDSGVLLIAIPTVLLEIAAADMYLSLISLRKSAVANLQLFIKTSGWIPIFIAVSLIFPKYMNMQFLIFCWMTGIIASFVFLFVALRAWPWREIMSQAIDFGDVTRTLPKVWLIYLGDLGITGITYLDRYIVTYFLGVEATGIYMFFFQIANAAQVLVMASLVQTSLPALVDGYRNGEATWRHAMISRSKIVAGGAAVIFALTFVGLVILVHLMKRADLTNNLLFGAVLFVGVLIRSLSDMANYGLYSRHQDRALGVINVIGLFATVLFSSVSMKFFGLPGLAFGVILTSCFIFSIRTGAILRALPRLAGRPMHSGSHHAE